MDMFARKKILRYYVSLPASVVYIRTFFIVANNEFINGIDALINRIRESRGLLQNGITIKSWDRNYFHIVEVVNSLHGLASKPDPVI